MKKLLFSTMATLFIAALSFAQASLTCDSTFRDSGGFQVNYGDNEDTLYFICPNDPADKISLRFDFVDIAVNEFTEGNQGGCWDFLSIYNGPDTLSPFLAETLCGEVSQSGQYPSDSTSLLIEGDVFTSTHASGCLTVRFQSDDFINEAGWEAYIFCGEPCAVFETAPVDLTKSQQPVPFPDGVMDRVQLKFYKDSPQVKYTAADNAALDIEFWPIRDLNTNTPITDGDTSLIADKVKPGQDFFKWPVKFIRADIDPNTRYRWRVRTKCQSADQTISPWSDEKIFNTPDFDPLTGIYTPPGEVLEENSTKNIQLSREIKLFPNPTSGQELYIERTGLHGEVGELRVIDLSGRLIQTDIQVGKEAYRISFDNELESGFYLLTVEMNGETLTERFLVD